MLLSPLSPEALFGAKMTVNFLLICLAQAAILPLFFILYGDGFLRGIPMLLLLLLTANAGFAATGTLCFAITAGTGRNEALLPLLFFPLVMPLIAMAVKVSGMIFAAAVEIGLVFTTLVLVTGMLWGRPVWNVWWTWDPRLTTSLILWFIFAGYFFLRSSVEQRQRRATCCAVMAIAGFVDVPIVFLSARLWRSIHPVVITAGSIGMAPAMVTALLVSMAAFAALWGILLHQRSRTLALAERIRFLETRLDRNSPAAPATGLNSSI